MAVLLLSSCSAVSPTPTDSPTSTLPPGTPTPTIRWFPATNTPVQLPSQVVLPTPEYHPGIGSLIFADTFDDPDLWNTSTSAAAGAIVVRNQLVLSVDGHGSLSIASLRSQPDLGDFYAEATADISLCSGTDQYGMIFRAAPGENYYRFAVNCNGEVRLERKHNGEVYPIQNWVPSGDATFGAPAHIRLGLWVAGNEFRLFLNDNFQFSVRDPLFHNGSIGFFAYASGKTTVTASFSDLLVYSVVYTPPTATPTPTRTLKPSRTPTP
jgi:hypothetical protein